MRHGEQIIAYSCGDLPQCLVIKDQFWGSLGDYMATKCSDCRSVQSVGHRDPLWVAVH